MSSAVHPQEVLMMDVKHWHMLVWAFHSTFHFFIVSSLNPYRRGKGERDTLEAGKNFPVGLNSLEDLLSTCCLQSNRLPCLHDKVQFASCKEQICCLSLKGQISFTVSWEKLLRWNILLEANTGVFFWKCLMRLLLRLGHFLPLKRVSAAFRTYVCAKTTATIARLDACVSQAGTCTFWTRRLCQK